jgi:hypothetical protein
MQGQELCGKLGDARRRPCRVPAACRVFAIRDEPEQPL